MNTDELVKKIKDYGKWPIIDQVVPFPDFRLSGTKLFVKGQTSYSSRILYVAPIEQLEEVISWSEHSHITVAFWTNEPYIPHNIQQISGNVIVVSTAGDEIELLTYLTACFSVKLEKQFRTEDFYDLLLNGSGLSKMTALAAEIYGNPIWITDLNYKYLAMNYWADNPNDEINHEYSTGYLHERSINAIIANNMYEKISSSVGPVYFKLPGYEHGFLSCAIRISSSVVAFVTMYEINHLFTDSDTRSLLSLSKALALELQKNHFLGENSTNAFSSIMIDLLSGNLKDRSPEKVIRRLKQLGYILEEYIAILVIGPKNSERSNIFPQFIIDRVTSTLYNSIGLFYNQSIVILISSKKRETLQGDSLNRLLPYLKDCNLSMGVSNISQNIIEADCHYIQATKALELAKIMDGPRDICYYSEYVLFHAIQKCDSSSAKIMLHPALAILEKADKEKSTELLQTLRCYLQCNHDTMRTADLLGIHKNTLYYRLDQIVDYTGISFECGAESAHLWLSFCILDYLQKTESNAE